MLILPLPNRPDWNHPPIVTLLLIALCTIVFMFFQGTDFERQHAALEQYERSDLPRMELPAYVQDVRGRGETQRAEWLERALGQMPARVLAEMEAVSDFMARLHAGRVITPEQSQYEHWRQQRSQYESLRSRIFTLGYSLHPDHPTPVTLLSHMFLHGGLLHLVGNMVVLFIVGYTVEAALGSAGFLLLYLAAGLGAAVPDVLLANGSSSYTLGASGAISGVMAAYVVLFGLRRIRFFYWFLVFFDTARWPAIVILPVWLANELLQRYVFDREGNTNYLAHFGGFLTGAILVGGYRLLRGGRTAASVEQLDGEARVAELRELAARHMAAARFDRAAPIYARVVELAPHDEAALGEFFRVATLARDTALIAQAAERLFYRASRPDCGIDARLIARVCEQLESTGARAPALSLRALDRIARRLIEAGEFDVAEPIVLRVVVRDTEGAVSVPLLQRLMRLLHAAGQRERAARARDVLLKRHPHLLADGEA